MQPSTISSLSIDGRDFFVKRDDLIDPFLAGNKYRKLYTLLQTPSQTYDTIISYGGTQSNAMLAIAAMCKMKGWKFIYYTKQLSSTQTTELSGNYYHAISLGMQHHEIDTTLYRDFIASLSLTLDKKVFLLHQGGADRSAEEGLEVLAQEINSDNVEFDALATPSGTGTTALYLAKALPQHKIYTTPCVGDANYLKEQMLSLVSSLPENLVILEPKKKYHFAKLYKEFFTLYEKLMACGIEFDLLYAPAMWQALLEQTTEKILYVHSGGVSGNESMLKRYKQKGFMSL